jgi:hypothetical protein
MAHRFGQPVQVTLAASLPVSFLWRGAHYPIAEVLATWHLRDRWWEAPAAPGRRPSDRRYYRVRCAGEQIFELYHDAVSDHWVLDRAYD